MAYIRDENGQYKRTVRCSYCWQAGHTRRTCPDLHPFGTEAQQRKKAEAKAKAERKLLGIKEKRRCTYCGETGHIRRKCETLAKDKLRVEAAIYEYRYAISEHVKEWGLGEGAVISAHHQTWSDAKKGWIKRHEYFMVLGLDWASLDPHSNWRITKRGDKWGLTEPMKLMSMTNYHYSMGQTLNARMMTFDDDGETKLTNLFGVKYRQGVERDRLTVVSKGTTNIPEDYLDKQAIREHVDAYFKGTKTKAHYQFLSRLDEIAEGVNV